MLELPRRNKENFTLIYSDAKGEFYSYIYSDAKEPGSLPMLQDFADHEA